MRHPRLLTSAAAIFAFVTSVSAQEVNLRLPAALEDLRGDIENASLTFSLGGEEAPIPQDFVAAARADYRRILTALYAAGYYGGAVSIRINGTEAARISPLTRLSSVETVDISVDPGPQFSFGRTNVAPVAQGTVLPEGFAPGEPAQSGVVRDAAGAAVDGWRDNGYAKAGVTGQDIRANHRQQLLDVDIALGTGPRLTFGEPRVSGNVGVRTERIEAIAGLPVGEVYSPKAVQDAANRLRRTGAFDSVAITEDEAVGQGDTLGTEIQVDEAPARRIGAGAEYSTVDGLKVSGYWMHRNLLGGAENLRIEAEVAGINIGSDRDTDYTLGFDFLRPQSGPFRSDLYANGAVEVLKDPLFELKQVRTEVGFSRLFGDDLTVSAGLGLQLAEADVGATRLRYSVVSLPLSAELDRRDNALNARSGYYLHSDIKPFAGFGGVDSGLRAYVDGRAYRTFGESRPVTLAARSQIGSLLGGTIDASPSDYLFFSGGGDTVRGQSYQSLGVTTATGTTGGLSLATLSLEARVEVTRNIGVVGFYDAGYVGASATPLTNGDWHAGTGLGIRYNTGIGPIRLDLATPASGDRFAKELSVYVGIGQSF